MPLCVGGAGRSAISVTTVRRVEHRSRARLPSTNSARTEVCIHAAVAPDCYAPALSALHQNLRNKSAGLLTACLLSWLALSPSPATASPVDTIQIENYVVGAAACVAKALSVFFARPLALIIDCGLQLDIAKVIPDEEEDKLELDLKSLEQ